MKKRILEEMFYDRTLKDIILAVDNDKYDKELIDFANYHNEKIINDHIFHEEYGIFDVALFRELVFILKNKKIVKIINVYEANNAKIIPFNDTVVVSGHKSLAIYDLNTTDYITWSTG